MRASSKLPMKKHTLKKIRRHLKRKKHHVGYTTSALVFLGLGMLLAQNEGMAPPQGMPPPPHEEEEFFVEDFVDPREIENALRDITRLKGEARGLAKRAAKNPDLQQRLNQIIAELDSYARNIKNPPDDYSPREPLQEFYEARMWEEVGKIRAQVELPQILKELPLVIKRVEGLLKLKAYQKLGLDMTSLKTYLDEIKEAHKMAQTLYAEKNYDEAMEALQFMHENGQPGELEGSIRRLKELNDRMRPVKDKQIKEQLGELLTPVTEAINEGDFRIANEILNDVYPEIILIIKKTYKINQKTRIEILKQLSAFESKVNAKLDAWEGEQMRAEEQFEPMQKQPIEERGQPMPPSPEQQKEMMFKKEMMQQQPPMMQQQPGSQQPMPPQGFPPQQFNQPPPIMPVQGTTPETVPPPPVSGGGIPQDASTPPTSAVQ